MCLFCKSVGFRLCLPLCAPLLPCAAQQCPPPTWLSGTPGPCPARRSAHRASFCSAKQTYTPSRELRHHQFTSSRYKRRLSACNLPLQGKLPYKSKYFISPITKQENLFQLTFKSPNLFSHYSLRQTGVGMLTSRFQCGHWPHLLRTGPGGGGLADRRPSAGRGPGRGAQASRLHTVIALVLSRTPECASEHGVSVSPEGQDRNLDFSTRKQKPFLLSLG